MTELNDAHLERYSRHILLNEIDLTGQIRLLDAHVLIIGCGGLGSACIPLLASSGVGHLTLVDADVIELSNLQRQTSFHTADVGKAKVAVMARTIHALNPEIHVHALQEYLTESRLLTLMQTVDVVLVCVPKPRLCQALRSDLRGNWLFMMRETTAAHATRAYLNRMKTPMTAHVQHWGFSRRWCISSAQCKRV
jgi:tRNA A37 threonylcarbamoyladenosine dehydratase